MIGEYFKRNIFTMALRRFSIPTLQISPADIVLNVKPPNNSENNAEGHTKKAGPARPAQFLKISSTV